MSLWDSLSDPWKACMEEAWAGFCADSWPMGAVIADGRTGAIMARGRNLVGRPGPHPLAGSGVAHAELIALGQLKRVPSQGHREPRLYCTTEPCLMCAGAVRLSVVREVVYVARDPIGGATRTLKRLEIPVAQARLPELQDVIIALMTVRALNFTPRRDWPIVEKLGAASAAGLALGKELHRAKAMRALRAHGADAQTMIGAVLAHAGK